MDRAALDRTFEDAQRAVESGLPLGATGFWKAVDFLKANPALADEYADRAGRIDEQALRSWALVAVPLRVGNFLMITATVGGFALIWWSYYLSDLAAAASFLVGLGVLLVTTHGLGHLIVGSLVGIRFTNWFIGSVRMPQPGVKTDYASYLRAPAMSRAWMHASGAIVTKLVPFALIGAAVASNVPGWVVWVLLVLGLAVVATDFFWSTKSSDWKKFLREREFAQSP